jgi:hypothetical protein
VPANTPKQTASFAREKAAIISTALALLFVSFAPPALASAEEELSRAAAVSGDVQKTSAEQFVRGFTATVVRMKRREIPGYVYAALHLRADLAPQIAAAALTVERNRAPADRRGALTLIGRIITSAIEGNRPEAVATVQAALDVAPSFAECIVSAAIAAAPDQKIAILRAAQTHPTLFAFLRVTRTENASVSIERAGALNPGSLSVPHNITVVVSPEQVPSGL